MNGAKTRWQIFRTLETLNTIRPTSKPLAAITRANHMDRHGGRFSEFEAWAEERFYSRGGQWPAIIQNI